ncbi:toprim domain-containing protein [Sinorhizobium meliloti]|uniref:toprim domain-containing protein n=1 Tax=Rhizobium meliloti TaxID=382 RepID=UPI000FDC6C2A|nr:toprim domain-containing protein [Sinorhizobium meliloti]RVH56248.1 toprim domain-containing protein [Sinorhizobium meliloti]
MPDLDEIISQFLDAMRSAGVNIDTGSRGGGHPRADGKLHRADALGKKQKKNGHIWYILHADGIAAGAFGDLQAGVEDTWSAKKPSSMTADEKAALKAQMKAAREQREAERAAGHARAAAASALIMKATTKADPEHPYLAKKGLAPFPGLRQLAADVKYEVDPEEEKPRVARKGWLVVPVFSPEKELVGAQLIQPDGTKRFVKFMAKEGNYHSIGAKPSEENGVICIGEGYATMARVHAATGYLCIVAFDAGNLGAVGAAIRKKYPRARIVITADNDRHTMTPVENPGLTKAREAADKIKARVAFPVFEDGDLTSTDFDDLASLHGVEAVKATIESVINPPREEPPPPSPEDYGAYDSDPVLEPDHGRDAGPSEPAEELPLIARFGEPHFKCLGVDGTTCFFQPANVSQVIELPASAMKGANMLRLAPLQWWEFEFPGKKEGVDWNAAVNACMNACLYRRKFVRTTAMRGRGAWFEGQSAIFHAGDHLLVDGEVTAIHKHDSKFVYDEGESIPVAIRNPATTEEARAFLNLCKSLRWEAPMSGYLLAGWCVVAAVCGFLGWRPHIWVNGPAGSGKSTVMDKIIKQLLDSTAISVVGATTEAGIRGALGMDALPIIFDESEPKDMQNQLRIKAILDLARVAASESRGKILKGTSNQNTKGYSPRSMFAFASINTQIEGYADETRFTQLTLAGPPQGTPEEEAAAKAHWEKLVSEMVALLTPDYSRRLLARTILNLSVLREYVTVFTAAATLHLGAQRLGDQLGPMLAGAYLLNTTKQVTVEKALEWIRANDWAEHTAKDSAKDVDRFIQHITSHMVRHQTPEGGTWERTVGELIEIAAYEEDQVHEETTSGYVLVTNKRKDAAIFALSRVGIKVRSVGTMEFVVDITSTHENFKRLLAKTEWAGTKWRKILLMVPGAVGGVGNRYFSRWVNTPFVSLPIDALAGSQRSS